MSVTGGMLGAYGLGGASTEQDKQVKQSTRNLQGMNSALMSGTFALTSLSAMGSMTGGKIGDLSQQVMKFSGVLFALMSVTQLLTQAKILELAATRMSVASNAVKAARGGMGIAGNGLFAKTGLFGQLARGALFVKNFLGPIGLAIGVTTLLVGGFMKLKRHKKRRRERFWHLEMH